MTFDDAHEERARRERMWDALLARGGPGAVSAAVVRDLGIYGGVQGVWVDKERTAPCTADGRGASVGLLHTGRHYADDLSGDGVLYHYPRTSRPAARDANEVDAAKNAGRLRLPVFIITQRTHASRDVLRGWVADWDDESRLFLITFGDESAGGQHGSIQDYASTRPDEEPFVALETVPRQRREVNDRPGQQRFKFAVFKRYGPKCGVCDVAIGELLQAAHIIPKEEQGSDDSRNGLVLCANHHVAFDAGLFAIEPETLALCLRAAGPSAAALGLTASRLSLRHGAPHVDALAWRFARRADT